MDKEALIEFIEEAFDGVEQLHDITLHVAEAHDQEHGKKSSFGRWQDIPSEHVKKCQTALSYVDKIGMCYYLPAYMVWHF